jgi:hypothetical protein
MAISICATAWKDGKVEQWNNGQNRITFVSGSRVLGSILTIYPWMFLKWILSFFNEVKQKPNIPSFPGPDLIYSAVFL